ncbi:hypothetical protein [Antarctobacter sp.]|uniref:hypothetical protein n=1 Tax=Antarctobacter sp. TaxID=1872577 RepID=UPI002B264BD8|nr:hypothetical protein [Antarctobacter sp.]
MTAISTEHSSSINALEFAAWAVGEINSNIKRAQLAEFVVGKALGCLERYHEEWNAFDLEYRKQRIEVKSSGYGTPPFYPTKLPPKPKFDIKARRWAWSNKNQEFLGKGEPTRFSDVYVFAATIGTTRETFHPFDTLGWEFYVASTEQLDKLFPNQKTVSASALESIFGKTNFVTLRAVVDKAIGETNE